MSHYQTVAIDKIMARALHLNAAALTIAGQGRRVNEDALFHYSDQMDTGESLGLYVVCDGIGEPQVEDTVSQLVVQTVIAELGKVFAVCEIPATDRLAPTETAVHLTGNPFCRTLGASEQVEVDLFEWKVWPGDKLLLCSDGLWGVFPDRNELGQWLGSVADPDLVCEQLVDEANRRNGADDMSALVIYVEGGDGNVDSGNVN